MLWVGRTDTFIQQLGNTNERNIFITTAQMEDRHKSSILADSLGIGATNFQRIVVDPNSPDKIINLLLANKWDSETEYIVNITGGTKMMSQMVYNVFKEFSNAKIYYWPIHQNYAEQLHPDFRQISFNKDVNLDLKTYFIAHGYSFSSLSEISHTAQRAENLFEKVLNKGSAGEVSEIARAKKNNYLRPDKPYLAGGWFEEWLYYNLRNELKLEDSQIGLNLKLKSRYSKNLAESDNEIDIAFVYKNNLYIIECKVFNNSPIGGKKITDSIYKISSLRQSLGLSATAFVCILSPFGKDKNRMETIRYLSEMAKINKVFSLEDMKNKTKFFQELKSIVGFE